MPDELIKRLEEKQVEKEERDYEFIQLFQGDKKEEDLCFGFIY